MLTRQTYERRPPNKSLTAHTFQGVNWLLADDNARPHRVCVVDAYLHEQDIIRMDWAPYRPDINSIEHIWDKIGRGSEELEPQSVNLRQLGVVVQNLWQQIPLERVQTLVSSKPRRVRALVDARESSTRYCNVDTLGLT